MAIELAELIQRIRVDVSSMLKAEIEADRLGAKLDALSGKSIKIDSKVDILGAEASILRLATMVDRQDGRKIRITTEMDTNKAELGLRGLDTGVKTVANTVSGFEKSLASFGSTSGFSGILAQLKIPAIVSGFGVIAQALSTAAAGAIAFTGAVAPVAGLAAVLPGLGLALKSATLGFNLLTAGSIKAGTAINSYGANSRQAINSMRNLTLAQKAFAFVLSDFQTQLQNVQKAGQNIAFPKFTQAIRDLGPFLPVLSKAFAQLSGSLGNIAINGAKLVASGPFSQAFSAVASSNATVVASFGKAGLSLVDALVKVMAVAAPLTQHFAALAASATAFIDAVVSKDIANGSLIRFLGHAQTVGQDLFHILSNVGTALFSIFKIGGANLGGGLLQSLVNLTDRFKAFVDSAKGQNSIVQFFENAKAPLQAMGRLFGSVFKSIATIVGGSQNSLTAFIDAINYRIIPAFTTLAQGAQGALLPAIVNVVEAFLKFANVLSFSPFITLVNDLSSMAVGLTTIITKIPGLGQILAVMLAIGAAMKIAAIAANALGVGKLVTAFSGLAASSVATNAGLGGFVAGLRGVAPAAAKTEAATVSLSNKIGKGLLSGIQTVGTAASSLPGPLGKAGTAMSNVGTAQDKLGKGLGAIGGALPFIGVAFAVAATAVGIFAQSEADARARVDDLTAAIQKDNGVIGTNTTAITLQQLQQKGLVDQASKYGITVDMITHAALGEKGAIDAVNAALLAHTPVVTAAQTAGGHFNAGLTASQTAINGFRQSLKDQGIDLDKAIADYRTTNSVLGQTSLAYDGTTGKVDALTSAINQNTANIDANISAIQLEQSQLNFTGSDLVDLAAKTSAMNAAQKNYTGVLKTHTAASKEGRAATAALKAAQDAYKGSLLNSEGNVLSMAKAAGDNAVNQAKAAGQTNLAGAAAKGQLAEYKLLQGETQKGGPLWNAIQGYIDKLLSIPGLITTTLTINEILGTSNVKKLTAHGSGGGLVTGGGTGTSDSIPAMLSAGEFVVTAAATKLIGAAELARLNALPTGGVVHRSALTHPPVNKFAHPAITSLSAPMTRMPVSAPTRTAPAAAAPVSVGGTPHGGQSGHGSTPLTINFINNGMHNEVPSDMNARQLRSVRTTGIFGRCTGNEVIR